MVDYAGAAVGTAFGELFALVEHVVKTVSAFGGQLKKIQTTLGHIEPIIKSIHEYNDRLNRGPEEMAPIKGLLEEGKVLVGKCSKIHAHNVVAKYAHSKKLADFNAALVEKFQVYMTLLTARDEKEMLVDVKEVKEMLTTVVWRRGAFQSGPGAPDFIVGSEMVESSRRRITSWRKGDLLGRGTFATVYEGFDDAGFFFAIKDVSLLDQGSIEKQIILELEQEISLLSQFEHKNIVRYFGIDKDDKKLYIFLELMTKGSLATLYHKYGLTDSQVSAYTRQILDGLKYLHDRNVIHRDIRCANILVDASGAVKLSNFGLATKMTGAKSLTGSPFWMAPEVVNLNNGSYGLAADIWSLGCTVLEMLTRQHPYSQLEGIQALFRIAKGEPPLVPDSLSREARDLILRCLQVNPSDRPSAAQLLDHPFVRKPSTTRGEQPNRVYPVSGLAHPKNMARNQFPLKSNRESVPIFENRLEPVRFPVLGKNSPRSLYRTGF